MKSNSSNKFNEINDRIQLPLFFDTDQLQKDVSFLNNTFEYYDSIPLRAPSHLVDSSIPFPPPANDYADGSWTTWMDTPTLKKCPYITSVIGIFEKKTTVNLVRLLRLAPQSVVKEHVDPTLGIQIEKSMVRLTIPIKVNDKVKFYLNNTIVPMKPGECWYLKLTDPHKIINDGDEERINLTIDVIPNDWVKSLIYSN